MVAESDKGGIVWEAGDFQSPVDWPGVRVDAQDLQGLWWAFAQEWQSLPFQCRSYPESPSFRLDADPARRRRPDVVISGPSTR